MGLQAADLGTLTAPGYINGDSLCLDAGKTANCILDGDVDADCVVKLQKSLDNSNGWETLNEFVEDTYSEETVVVTGPGYFRFRLEAPVDDSDQSSTLDATIEDAQDVGDALSTAATEVATTAATSTVPFGYAEAQANALLAAVNALIVRQGEIEALLISKGVLPPALS